MKVNETLLYRHIGRKVRTLREKRQPPMTQENLGSEIGFGRSSIAQIESGKQKTRLHTLYNLCNALGVEPVEVLPTWAQATTAPEDEEVTAYGQTFKVPPLVADFLFKHAKRSSRS